MQPYTYAEAEYYHQGKVMLGYVGMIETCVHLLLFLVKSYSYLIILIVIYEPW